MNPYIFRFFYRSFVADWIHCDIHALVQYRQLTRDAQVHVRDIYRLNTIYRIQLTFGPYAAYDIWNFLRKLRQCSIGAITPLTTML